MRLIGKRTPDDALASALLNFRVAFDREGAHVADRFRRGRRVAAESVDERRRRGGRRSLGYAAVALRGGGRLTLEAWKLLDEIEGVN